MLQYLKNLIQLILAPAKGWEDVSASLASTEHLLRDAFFPLLGVAAVSEFIRLFYHNSGGFLTVFELAIALFGSYFVSFFIGRIILSNYIGNFIDGEVNQTKLSTFIIYGLGLLLIIEIIENILPTDLTLVKFLPLFVALILYRATTYLSVKQGSELRFLCIAALAVIVVPIALFSLLELIIS
ncbi:MAG: hypothetical protein K2I89_00555 [Muribaculaceae bacterium]|nr:hypothetical protein [Muribaculaceae bacterium]